MVEGYYGAVQRYEMKPKIFDPEDEKGIVDHMNNDHSNSLIQYCRLLGMNHINEKDAVFMTGIDLDGFDMKVKDETVRFSLDQPMKAAMNPLVFNQFSE